MDGHDFDRFGTGLDVGLGVELGQAVGQRAEVFQLACVFEALELVEVDLGVGEVGAVGKARRAAEREPDAFDAVAQGPAQALLERGLEDGDDSREPGNVLDQLPDRLLVPAFEQTAQFIQVQAAPRCAQDGEPGDAVGQVRQRARQRIEVLHHLLLA